MTTTTNGKVAVDCGRCVRGTYHFPGGSGPCYACEGTGKRWMSAAAYARIQRGAAQYAARCEAERTANGGRTNEEVMDLYHEYCYGAAEGAILNGGIQGAREFFAAHRREPVALESLVGAMRDHGLIEPSNKVVRHLQTTPVAGFLTYPEQLAAARAVVR